MAARDVRFLASLWISLIAVSALGHGADFRVSLDPRGTCSAIEMAGEIKEGDHRLFGAAVAEAKSKAPFRRLYLNSGGGNFAASAMIWQLLRAEGSDVDAIIRAGQECNSACVMLLVATARARVSFDAIVILHAARRSGTPGPAVIATMAYSYYLVEGGVSKSIVGVLLGLQDGQQIRVVPSNAAQLGFGKLSFFGSSDPPATAGCAWPGFVVKTLQPPLQER